MKTRFFFCALFFSALPVWGGFSFIFVSSNLIVSYNTSSHSPTNAIVVGPSINRQPVSQAATTGDLALFHATASGTQPLTYQWMKGAKNLINGGRISGVTTGTLRIRKVNRNDAGLYRLRVSNSAGSATSNSARLTVSRR